jgi:hypothetical protein
MQMLCTREGPFDREPQKSRSSAGHPRFAVKLTEKLLLGEPGTDVESEAETEASSSWAAKVAGGLREFFLSARHAVRTNSTK